MNRGVMSHTHQRKSALICAGFRKDYGETYDDWVLPSLDELKLMYILLKYRGTGKGCFSDAKYKASSEYITVNNSWHNNFEKGTLENNYIRYYSTGLRIRPVRASK